MDKNIMDKKNGGKNVSDNSPTSNHIPLNILVTFK